MLTRRLKMLRVGFLSLCPVLSLTGLLAFSSQTPPPQKKLPAFPLSLFAQATPDDYIDEEACAQCHTGAHASFQPSPHNPYSRDPKAPKDKQGCQGCHGPGGIHLANLEKPEEIHKFVISYTKSTATQSSMACLRCHNDTMTMAHWVRTGHGHAEVSCAGCHGIHQDPDQVRKLRGPKMAKSPIFAAVAEPKKMLKADEATLCGSCHQRELNEFRHNFHHPVPEGRIVCSSCHEIHPRRANEKLAAGHTHIKNAGQLCVTCHAETAGPFVFEHDPVSGTTGEGCMECHRPHGSHNPKMLSSFSRGLCNQCHTDKANNHFPGRTCWQSGCHVGVHGSHSDRLLLRR
jgi:predicted CXXCH cytochrome family protein